MGLVTFYSHIYLDSYILSTILWGFFGKYVSIFVEIKSKSKQIPTYPEVVAKEACNRERGVQPQSS